MTPLNNSKVFPSLILLARPAAGKSEIIDYLFRLDDIDRRQIFHIGNMIVMDDFPFLWRWFEEDDLLARSGKPRLYTDDEGYFKFDYFWDLLINMINLEFSKTKRNIDLPEPFTRVIEFSRGVEHGGYKRALSLLSEEILGEASILFLDVSWEESLRKNRKRFNPEKPDSILEHGLPDEKLKRLYFQDDFLEMVEGPEGLLHISNFNVPFVVFDNQKDLTGKMDHEFRKVLKERLNTLWEIRYKS